MCLLTTQKEPSVAEKDIEVYKLLGLNMIAPHYTFKYEENKEYTTEMKENTSPIGKDLWNCFDQEEVEAGRQIDESDRIFIAQGFHSAGTEGRLRQSLEDSERFGVPRYLYHAVIPKGALYYKSPTYLYVSNKIMITGHIR